MKWCIELYGTEYGATAPLRLVMMGNSPGAAKMPSPVI